LSLSWLAAILFNAASVFAQDTELIRHFDYDQNAPLGIKQIGVEHSGDKPLPAATIASIPDLFQPATQN
jgi:hypothetical protein